MLKRNSRRMSVGYDQDGNLAGCRCNSQQGTRVDVSFELRVLPLPCLPVRRTNVASMDDIGVDEYIASRTPRVADVPSSAPRYDQMLLRS